MLIYPKWKLTESLCFEDQKATRSEINLSCVATVDREERQKLMTILKSHVNKHKPIREGGCSVKWKKSDVFGIF